MKKIVILSLNLIFCFALAQTEELTKIDSFQNSKVIIFSKEISKNFLPDSIETFTPSKKEYQKLLSKIEKKSFKAWNQFNKWFYQDR